MTSQSTSIAQGSLGASIARPVLFEQYSRANRCHATGVTRQGGSKEKEYRHSDLCYNTFKYNSEVSALLYHPAIITRESAAWRCRQLFIRNISHTCRQIQITSPSPAPTKSLVLGRVTSTYQGRITFCKRTLLSLTLHTILLRLLPRTFTRLPAEDQTQPHTTIIPVTRIPQPRSLDLRQQFSVPLSPRQSGRSDVQKML